jgi:hypothetical protein
MDHNDHFNQWIAGSAVLGTIFGWFPIIAAGVALCWYVIQIYESETVQRWLTSRRLRKIAALRAKVVMLEAITRLPSLVVKTEAEDD